MRAVNFSFRADVDPKRRAEVLQEIAGWPSIRRASALDPKASDPVVQRMCYAYVEDDGDLDAVVRRLQQQPTVESASIPARRRLV